MQFNLDPTQAVILSCCVWRINGRAIAARSLTEHQVKGLFAHIDKTSEQSSIMSCVQQNEKIVREYE